MTNPFTHTGLTNDTPYYYAVSAVFEGDIESELSAIVTATPVLIDITAPQNAYAVMNHGAFMTNSPEVVVTISANDIDTGVGAYLRLRSAHDADGWHARVGGCDTGDSSSARRFPSSSLRATARRRFLSGSKTWAATCPRRRAPPFW